MDVRGAPPDAEVVALVLAGDTEAFGFVIRRYEAGLLRFAARMLGSRTPRPMRWPRASFRAYRHLASCREPARLRTWLYRIVTNRCKSHLARRVRRRPFHSDDDAPPWRIRPTPRRTWSGRPARRRGTGLQTSRRQGEAFVLKHVEGLSTKRWLQSPRAHSDAQDARASRPGKIVEGAGGPRMSVIDQRFHQVLDGELAAELCPRSCAAPWRASRGADLLPRLPRDGDEPRIARAGGGPSPGAIPRAPRHALARDSARDHPPVSRRGASVRRVVAASHCYGGQEGPNRRSTRGSPSSSAGSPRRSRCTPWAPSTTGWPAPSRWEDQTTTACGGHGGAPDGPTSTCSWYGEALGPRTTSRSVWWRRLGRENSIYCAAGPSMKRWCACCAPSCRPASPPSRCRPASGRIPSEANPAVDSLIQFASQEGFPRSR